MASGRLPDGYAADDYTALVFRDGDLAEAIAEAPERYAYRVDRNGDNAVETQLDVRLLM